MQDKKRDYAAWSNRDSPDVIAGEIDYKTPHIFIDQLLKLSIEGNYFTDADVRDESNTIVATGFESTALISSYCILMLAMHPAVQARLYKEIMGVAPGSDADLEYEDLAKLEYLERVLKETMRLFPTVPTIARHVTAPFRLGPYDIPADTHIMVGIMSLHRSEKNWGPTAAIFDPERFLPENMATIHSYAYIPFSAGSRNCLGIKYAMMFLKVIVVKLLRSFEFATALEMHELRHSVHISLKLENKHLVSVRRRPLVSN